MPTNPLSPYALQKLVGEQYMQMFTALYGLETVTIRYFNVFGPRQDPSSPYSGVISVFAKALLENKAPTIYGDGEQTRDFTYVANVVDGVLRAVTAPGASGQVINVATGTRISLNQLFASMRDADRQPTGACSTVPHDPATSRIRWPTSRAPARCSATSRWCRSKQGLKKTIDWYRDGTS